MEYNASIALCAGRKAQGECKCKNCCNGAAYIIEERRCKMRISKRCQNIKGSVTLEIDAKAKEMKAQGLDVVGFGAGEPDFDTPEHIRQAAKEALDKGMTRYTPASGTMDLKKAICEKFLRDNGLHYEPSQIVVSNGAKHSLFNSFQALLDEGDEVIVPGPFWVSYPELVRMAGGVPVVVQAREENSFKLLPCEIEAAVTGRTRAIILNSPNNPNGFVYTRQELQDIGRLAVKHDFYIISDEIYEYLVYDGAEHVSIASLGDEIKARTITINGMSKAYSMTGWRLGYCMADAKLMDRIQVFHQYCVTSVPSFVQRACVTALETDTSDVVEIFRKRRDYVYKRLTDMGLEVEEPTGAFYMFINIQKFGMDSLTFCRRMLQEGLVGVIPGIYFGTEGYMRLSYCYSDADLKEGLDRIETFIKSL